MRFVALAVTLAIAGVAHAQGMRPAGAGTAGPVVVNIVGSDYSYLQAPNTMAPGPTLFGFENRGKVRHEMILLMLKHSVTPEEMMRAATIAFDSTARGMAERVLGVLIAQPGDSTWSKLLVDLLPNRSYALVCQFQDSPSAMRHNVMGMVAAFRVTPRERR